MKLADMENSETEALFSLLRTMVRLDGEYSAEEAGGLMEVATALGEAEFKRQFEESAGWDLSQPMVQERARAVVRTEAQEEIYGALYTVALSDGVSGHENELLEWLARIRNLEISQGDPSE